VAWLQHLYGPQNFSVVPLLCPDPCGPSGTVPDDGNGMALRVFAESLGELIASDPTNTLVVAGADFSHIGSSFGDDRPIDDAFLEEVRQADRRALDFLELGDPAGFLRCIAQQDNPTRICSAGCMFALLTALPGARGQVVRYHQAVDRESQTCVSCAAVVFE
jgi:MEMO1 family protein